MWFNSMRITCFQISSIGQASKLHSMVSLHLHILFIFFTISNKHPTNQIRANPSPS